MILYRAGWRAALALARPLSHLDGKTGRTLRGRINGAAVLEAWARAERRPAAPLVWFHAASVGEGRQGEAVLRRLRERHPEWQLIFTYSSSSAERFAASLPVDFAGYLPVDTSAEVSRALDAARPAALVFSATDIWPELTAAAASRAVRLALVSATLAPTSSRRSGLARWLLRPAYAALELVGAIDSGDAAGLIELGARERTVCITGDTRHDAAEARVRAIDASAPYLRALAGPGRPLVVAGSTWPDDEKVLVPAWATVRAEARASRLVIAPHEPTERHLQRTEHRCRKALGGATVVRLSALEAAPTPAPDWDVCLVDRVGVLAEIYAVATVAFVGGAFHGKGLHSVIEPAALGVPVVFGPSWRGSRDARLLLEAGAARSVRETRALAAALGAFIADEGLRAATGRAARGVVEAGLGAAERTVGLIEELITKP